MKSSAYPPSNGMQHGKRKVISVLAISATAILGLAGCAPGASGSTSTKVGSVSTTLTSKKVVLSIADETADPITSALAKEFTKQHPNITFNITRDTLANLTANSPKLMAGSDAPDLIRLPQIGNTVKDKLLANLDPYYTAYGWDKWSASQLAALRVGPNNVRGSGGLYQLGLGCSVTGIYMNTKLATKLGITSAPASMGEFESDLAKAKAGGVLPMMEGDMDGIVGFTIQAAMNQYANKQQMSDWIYDKPGATFDTPGNVKGANLVATWAKDGYFPADINAIPYADFVTDFENGQGLFTFNGNWQAADYQAKMGKGNVEFFLVPPAKAGGKHVAMGTANSFSVPAKAKHISEIVYFLNWVHTNTKARQIVVDVEGESPGGNPAQAQPSAPAGLIAEAIKASNQLNADDGQVDFMSNATAGVYAAAMLPESQLLLTGKATGQQYVTAVQAEYAKELAG
jgi:raffinose/stachyose/melibiose transport system substrate-binding protein